MNGFTFNGTTSQSLGLLVTALNPYNSASRRVETIEIPYRNGNLIIDSGTYDNIMVSYEVSVIGNTKATCDAINEWLSGSQGYCILSDTYNTEFFRVGYFASSIEYVLTALYRYGKATLNFDCFPQKYLNSNSTITRSATSTTTTDEGGTFSSKVYPLPIDLKGNTTQTTYSGKQMYTLKDGTYTVDTITATVSNGIISISGSTSTTAYIEIALNTNISLTNGEMYTMALFNTTANANVSLCILSNGTYDTIADAVNKTQAFIYDSANTYYNDHFTIRVASGTSLTNFKLQPMLVKGNTAGDYEPYVGGISSPNPSYPQTVHNVSGDNSVIVCGKNMFRDYFSGTNTTRGVTKKGGENCVILNGTYDKQANLDLWLTQSSSSSATDNMTLMKANTSYAISVYFLNDYSITNVTILRVSTWSLDKTTFEWNGSGNPNGLVFDGNVAKGIYNNGNTPMYIGGIRMALSSTRSATFNDCIVKIQVEEANAVTPFEEYRGIDYNINLPVENLCNYINSRETNGVTFEYDSTTGGVYVHGLATANAYSDGTISATAVLNYPHVPAGTYTYSLNGGKGARDHITIYCRYWYADGTNGVVVYNSLTKGTFTITQPAYLYTIISVLNGYSVDEVVYPQLERGSNANTFHPYGTTPIELNKIGDYQDYIYKNGNKWYLHKEIGKLVLNGSENWYIEKTGTANWYYIVNNISSIDIITDSTNSNMICDHYPFGSIADSNTNQGMYIVKTQKQVRIRWGTEDTARNFKTWLSSNNVTVYYVLNTQTNTEITDATLLSQLNAIDNVMAFETSTTIAQVNNDAPFLLTYTNIGSANVSSDYRGEPIITVNETGMIYWNGEVIKVNAPMIINSKTMQCYDGTENLNNYVELNEFPMLKKGNNDIGSTMALSIVPNYWKL